jgi:hypothetical protein
MRLTLLPLALVLLAVWPTAPARAAACGYVEGPQGRYWSVERTGPVSCASAKRVAQRRLRTGRGTRGWRCRRTAPRAQRNGVCTRGARKVSWRFAPGVP